MARSPVALALLAAGLACGSSRETPPSTAEAGAGELLPYQVLITIVGDPAAFAGRAIEVEGRRLEPVRNSPTRWHVEQQLCTGDRARFLARAFRVVVREGERLLADQPLAASACAGPLGAGDPQPARGWQEQLTLVLGADGSLSLDPTRNPSCGATGARCLANENVPRF